MWTTPIGFQAVIITFEADTVDTADSDHFMTILKVLSSRTNYENKLAIQGLQGLQIQIYIYCKVVMYKQFTETLRKWTASQIHPDTVSVGANIIIPPITHTHSPGIEPETPSVTSFLTTSHRTLQYTPL